MPEEEHCMHFRRFYIPLLLLLLMTTACSSSNAIVSKKTSPAGFSISFTKSGPELCPPPLDQFPNCYSPQELRVAYGVQPLIAQGYRGEGQTVLIIALVEAPTFQEDINTFDQQFNLPPVTPQIVSIGQAVSYNQNNASLVEAAQEVELDVEVVHAFAPGAGIKLMMISSVGNSIDPTTLLQVERYSVDHHLGQIITQSLGFPESEFGGHQSFVQDYTNFTRQATTQQGITFFADTGDNGAQGTQFNQTATVIFPASDPWVTAVGGTSLARTGQGYSESAWEGSGGGVSTLFAEPDYQRQYLPSETQTLLMGHRGLPDVAADADPRTAMVCYILTSWVQCGGTSASTPFWAAIIAIADQLAGHPLGFINPGLYKLGVARQGDFRDITSGSNGVQTGRVSINGFQATAGWDAVTGWGVPQAYQFIGDLIPALAS